MRVALLILVSFAVGLAPAVSGFACVQEEGDAAIEQTSAQPCCCCGDSLSCDCCRGDGRETESTGSAEAVVCACSVDSPQNHESPSVLENGGDAPRVANRVVASQDEGRQQRKLGIANEIPRATSLPEVRAPLLL